MDVKRYNAKITRWGLNLGLRIPVDIVRKNNFRDKEDVIIQSIKNGFQVTKVYPEIAGDFVI